jgi:hypothetical protein
MKYMRFALLGLGLLLAVSATQAQQAGVKADIPFDFVVGNQVLPAGEYVVKPGDGAQQAVWIRSDEHKSAMVSIIHGCATSTPSDTTKLVFRTVGGQYFLSQIWTQGYSQGRELPQSKLEQQLAKNQPEGEFVLAANLTN